MEKKLERLYKAVLVLGIIAVIAAVFRVWAIFLVSVVLFIGARLWMHILRSKIPDKTGVKPCAKRKTSRTKKGISEQVSIWVNADFPEAKWVWAHANISERIKNGEDVYIILNGAGGYRRAKVKITGQIVVALEYVKAPIREPISEQKPVAGATGYTRFEEPGENYELLAYEWVEEHINELNERLNEAVGRGDTEYLLSASELPIKDSWNSVCIELKRVGVSEAVCIQDGIIIKIN